MFPDLDILAPSLVSALSVLVSHSSSCDALVYDRCCHHKHQIDQRVHRLLGRQPSSNSVITNLCQLSLSRGGSHKTLTVVAPRHDPSCLRLHHHPHRFRCPVDCIHHRPSVGTLALVNQVVVREHSLGSTTYMHGQLRRHKGPSVHVQLRSTLGIPPVGPAQVEFTGIFSQARSYLVD